MVRIPGIESEADVARWHAELRATTGRLAAAEPASRRAAAAPDPAAPRRPAKGPRSKSNLGKEWEAALIQTHELYESQGIGFVYQVSNSWIHCSKKTWDKLPPNKRAVTGDGRHIMRARTPCDFMGHYRGHPVGFDAKTSGDDCFNIEKYFKEHQCRALLKFKCGRSGATGGFMFEARAVSRCYFVDVDSAWALYKQSKVTSFDVDWLNQCARFVILPNYRGLYDWGAAMFPNRGES